MKRLMPNSLVTFLQNNRTCLKADCFKITLANGAAIYATEGQWDITFLASTPGWSGPQTTFRATQYGRWSRGRITSEASFKCAANTMALDCVPQASTPFPGLSLSILSAALNHLFDGATVFVYTAYMPMGGYGNVSAGVETKFQGTIVRNPGLSRDKIQFECADPLYLLNMKVPHRLMQSNCPWKFTDSNCGQIASNYTVNFTAASGSNQRSLTPTVAFTQADNYFARGVVTCITGGNAGMSQTVKLHSGGVLTVMYPWLLPVNAGDTFSVIKGCDLTLSMCKATVQANGTVIDNSGNFGGTPFAPVPSTFV